LLNINKKNLLKNFTQSPKTSILFILLVLGFGEWLISDIVDFSGGSLGFFILCGGSYFYFRNNKPKFNEPNDLKGWVDLCRNDLKFFDEQDEENTFFGNKFLRREELNIILNNDEKQKIAIIKGNNQIEYISLFNKYLRKNQYDLNLINELPSVNCSEVFCSELNKNEAIFYHLNLPLTAKGLIWLKKFPNDMPIWLILNKNNSSDLEHKIEELKSELPEELIKKIIKFDSKNMEFIQKPISFRKFIFNPKRNLENTKKLIEQMKMKTIYSEISLIINAEIEDRVYKNYKKAIKYYEDILEKFPDTIYKENILNRLNEINKFVIEEYDL